MGSERVQLIRLASTGQVGTFIALGGHRLLDVTVSNVPGNKRAITQRTIPYLRKVFALVVIIVIGRSDICNKFVNVRTKRIRVEILSITLIVVNNE